MRTRNRPYRWTTPVCAAAILVVAGCVTPINDADLSETSTSDISTATTDPDAVDPEPEVLDTPDATPSAGPDTTPSADPDTGDPVDEPDDAVGTTPDADVAVLDDTDSSPPDDEVPVGECDAETACLEYEVALSACYVENGQPEAAQEPSDYASTCADTCLTTDPPVDWVAHYECRMEGIPEDCSTESPTQPFCPE